MHINSRYVLLGRTVKKCFYKIEVQVGGAWIIARWENNRKPHLWEYDGDEIEDLSRAKVLLTKLRRRYKVPSRIVVVNLWVNAQVLDD